MPFYDYNCSKCGSIVEKKRKISQRNDEVLCQCGQPMSAVVVAPALHGIISDPTVKAFNDKTRNDLAKELKENDQHRRAEEQEVNRAIRSGEFM